MVYVHIPAASSDCASAQQVYDHFALCRMEVLFMAASAYTLFSGTDLAPGKSYSFSWKNVPAAKAYALDAHPYNPGSYQDGYQNTTQLEVTRFWRRTRQIQKPGDIGVTVEVHNDVCGEIKNVGTYPSDYDVVLIAIS